MTDPSTAREFGEKRLTKIGTTAAAVLRKEEHECAESANFGALNVVSSLFFRADQPSLHQHGEVRRERALREATRFH
jgi:hypothetical protein